MRKPAPSRLGVRTIILPVLLAAMVGLVALSACSPYAVRVPDGKAETLHKISVVPMEFRGLSANRSDYFHGGGDVMYLAGPRDNTVLGREFRGVVVDGVPVFFNIHVVDQGTPGRAERFEKLITGPRVRWLPSVDLAEIAARSLKAEGVEATAEREVARVPGLTRRNPDGTPQDWWLPLYEWFGKDPEPLDLAGYANRGAQAVLVVALGSVVPGGDVIGSLGFPSRVLRNGSMYAYDRKMGSWLVFIAAGGSGAGFVIPMDHLLLIEFDGENRVLRSARREGYTTIAPEFPSVEEPTAQR